VRLLINDCRFIMKKENEKYYVFGLIALGFLILILYSHHEFKKEQGLIKTYKGITIGYASSFKKYPKSKHLIYYFYVEDKKYLTKIGASDKDKSVLKKYYTVVFDEKNPEKNYLYINKPLEPDSISLIEAGFKYNKVYEHDFKTDTYKLRYEWK